MRLDTFFEKFEQFAETPNAVAKMRELVLGLAVRGRLVKQDPNDEPASVLLKQIYAAKSVRKFCTELSEDSTTSSSSCPFAIPSSWQWVGATTPAEIISDNGKKVPTKDVLPDGAYPVVDQGKVFIRGYCNDPDKVIEVTKPIVLFGDHTRETKFIDFDFVVGADGVKLLLPLCIDPFYYYLALRWLPLDSRGYGRHFKLLKASMVPLPPLAEQKRIVTKVDELMAFCDRLEAQQQERDTRQFALACSSIARFADAPTPANLNFLFHTSYDIAPADIRKAILTLAVQGKLVPQDVTEGVASLEFEVIQKRKESLVRDSQIKKAEIGKWIDPDEVDHDIPESWIWVRLVDICELITDGTHLTPKYTESGRMFLSAQNVKPFKFMPDKHRFVSEEHYQGYIKNRKPEKGDVLLTRVGAGIGEAATIDQDLDFAIYVSVGLVRPVRKLVFSDYITLWLNSPDGTAKSSRNTYGKGVSQGNLNLSLIRNFLVPLPPVAEQRRIVAKANQLMALVDQLGTQLTASRVAAINLMDAMVAELTAAQDNADSSIPAGSHFQ